MAHFAELDADSFVKRVIVISNADVVGKAVPEEDAGIAFCQMLYGADTVWVQTSYNEMFRYNYAGEGYFYDKANDAFIAPQPFPSWALDAGFKWQPPVPYPDDGGSYEWNEATTTWVVSTDTLMPVE